MLVSLTQILAYAEEQHCAIGAFNTPNLECISAVLRAASEQSTPVILSHAQLHETVSPLSVIGPVMVHLAERSGIPVCVHLDHCEDISYMEKALDLGFTGVMYDGSMLPYAKNLENTCKAVELAHRYGAGVEAEIGQLAAREGGSDAAGPVYTDPDDALRFSRESGIDALAPSFGTSHGIYKSKPRLDIDRVSRISRLTALPLVMHGGSGVSEEDYRRTIQAGIRKINYYSYMAKAGFAAAEQVMHDPGAVFFHDLAKAAEEAMYQDAAKAISVFSMK